MSVQRPTSIYVGEGIGNDEGIIDSSPANETEGSVGTLMK